MITVEYMGIQEGVLHQTAHVQVMVEFGNADVTKAMLKRMAYVHCVSLNVAVLYVIYLKYPVVRLVCHECTQIKFNRHLLHFL